MGWKWKPSFDKEERSKLAQLWITSIAGTALVIVIQSFGSDNKNWEIDLSNPDMSFTFGRWIRYGFAGWFGIYMVLAYLANEARPVWTWRGLIFDVVQSILVFVALGSLGFVTQKFDIFDGKLFVPLIVSFLVIAIIAGWTYRAHKTPPKLKDDLKEKWEAFQRPLQKVRFTVAAMALLGLAIVFFRNPEPSIPEDACALAVVFGLVLFCLLGLYGYAVFAFQEGSFRLTADVLHETEVDGSAASGKLPNATGVGTQNAPSQSQMKQVDEFYELEVGADLIASPRFNLDIAPTKIAQRTWNHWHIAALWVGMAICVPTYTLGGVLTTYFGLSVGEALGCVFIANVIVLVPLTLNAFGGTKFGIPFPVMLRSSFGIIGSNVPALIRALVACGWFGIQTLFGGIAVHLMLSAVSPGWKSLGGVGEVIGFFIFWIANVWVVIRGSESVKFLEVIAAPLLVLVGVGLLVWAWPQASITELFTRPANRPAEASFLAYFFAGLTAMVGFWATLSLNIPDFSRFAKSQRAQIAGQIIGLPLTMVLFAGLGVVMTAASAQIVGETVSDPITLIGKIQEPFWVVISMIVIIIATISTNTAANIVSPTNDFQNLAPRFINQKKGVLLTGFIGIALMGWELLKRMGWLQSDVSVDSLYSNWLLGYSSLLGPIAGIMVVDYFVVRKQHYDLPSLYRNGGSYPEWNAAGFVALLIPVSLTLIAIVSGAMQWFYTYGWFTGSALGAMIYWLMSRVKAGS